MIERIEIKDFENHKHTVIEDLSGGFNLIRGESNSGKTSIVRALKLVACNQFDPRSVRVGAKHCWVSVTTHRGNVTVTRGTKTNIWEVTPIGGVTETYSNIGIAVLPEVQEIMGMGMVELGDIALSVNIMDQLEAHFMLSELQGKKATGSVRAQIIDEISGLAGIEGLIRGVSLDNTRHGRESKRVEADMAELREQLHDQDELDAEGELLTKAQACLDRKAACEQDVKEVEALAGRYMAAAESVTDAEARLAALPDAEAAASHYDAAKLAFDEAALATTMYAAADIEGMKAIEKQLAAFPDAEQAQKHVEVAQRVLGEAKQAEELYGRVRYEQGCIREAQTALDALPDTVEAVKLCALAEAKAAEAREADVLCRRARQAAMNVEQKQQELDECERELTALIDKRDELMESFDTCPITLKPITGECLKDARMPVQTEKARKRARRAK